MKNDTIAYNKLETPEKNNDVKILKSKVENMLSENDAWKEIRSSGKSQKVATEAVKAQKETAKMAPEAFANRKLLLPKNAGFK